MPNIEPPPPGAHEKVERKASFDSQQVGTDFSAFLKSLNDKPASHSIAKEVQSLLHVHLILMANVFEL